MAKAALKLHSRGHLVTYEELKAVPTPQAEGRWRPVAHSAVLDTVRTVLTDAGYQIKSQDLAIAREGKRFFATLDLGTPLVEGVVLAVGIRNSTDKSFSLGFTAGNRVLVCSNLSFRSELLVRRKHTRNAVGVWNNELAAAVEQLEAFRVNEAARIDRMMRLDLTEDRALALIVRAIEEHVISAPVISKVLAEWRNPTHDYGTGDRPTAWRLLQSFALVLGNRAATNPTQYADQTIRLNGLILPDPQPELEGDPRGSTPARPAASAGP